MEEIFENAFENMSKSIQSRILGTGANSDLQNEINKMEQFMVENMKELDEYDHACLDSNVNNDLNYTFDFEKTSSNSEDNDYYSTNNFIKNTNCHYSNFMKSFNNLINLYDNVKQYSNDSDLRPPPIPVTEIFRKHNPEASNIFDFKNTDSESGTSFDESGSFSNDMKKIIEDSIHTCLIHPNDLDKVTNYSNFSQNGLFNKLNNSDWDSNVHYKLLKVLFGWYFAGYYTGRMELISQSQ